MHKIKGFRVMLGLTQKDMAKKLDLSIKAYFNKENGVNEFTVAESRKIFEMIKQFQPDVKYEDIFF